MEQIQEFFQNFGLYEIVLGLGKAILVLVIGFPLRNFLTRTLNQVMIKKGIDESLRPFLKSLFKSTLTVLILITAASFVGIETTSFVAILGAAGLAIGLALQGTLQNFAGGVIILVLRPFKVGDYVEAAGQAGTVREIQIFNTILTTPDNVRIIIPNGKLSNDNIKNYSAEEYRRVDMVFGIGYGDDIKKTKDLLMQMVTSDERILAEPAPQVVVAELADSSINFKVRPWVANADYWNVYFDFHERVKKEFDAAGISIPFPQRDVHLFQETA